MSGRLQPGFGERNREEKRLTAIERFLSPMQKMILLAKNELGTPQQFEVLASPCPPSLEPTINPAFSPSSIKKNGESYDVILNYGHVREILTDPAAGDAVIYHVPEYDSTALSSDPPPKIPMTNGDTLYVNYPTDKKGEITSDPIIVVSASDIPSVHYQLSDIDDPDGLTSGVEGNYYIKIGKLTIVKKRIFWAAYVDSEIVHYHELDRGGTTDIHPWKVTSTGTVDEYAILDDLIYGQGGSISIMGPTTLTCVGAGVIYVKVTRDVESRVLTTAILDFASVVPPSDYTEQYRPIAKLDGEGVIIQLQKQEIRIYELRVIVNGESKLMDFDTNSRLDYELPPA